MTDGTVRTPADIGVTQTLQFCLKNLPAPPGNLLEVGCGDGALAMKLAGEGYDVVAIDTDAKLVSRASRNGVHAETADWLSYQPDTSFDAILFTRSLHHIAPLKMAVGRIKSFLNPQGRVLVEDFAFAECDRDTASWGSRVFQDLSQTTDWDPVPDAFAETLRISRDPFSAWHSDHRLHLHRSDEMAHALEQNGFLVSVTGAPYLYRYLVQGLKPTAEGAEALQHVLDHEIKAIRLGKIQAIGRRFVAKPRILS